MPNPELTPAQVQRRRRIRNRKVKQQRGRCWWCDLPFSIEDKPTVDHLVPQSLGGKYWDILNIVVAHERCNKRRGHLGFRASGAKHRPKWLIDALNIPMIGTKLNANRTVCRRERR